jgi:hypothetical protein
VSNALAIAAVTAVLRDLLINGLIDAELNPSIGDINVTALPPDRIPIGQEETSQLNLFMYMVTPNQGWRNEGLPSRNGNGDRLTNPPLALDLHYLLTAYGAQDFHAEILLGNAMQRLHETPVLTRDAIRTALAPPQLVGGGGGLPPTLQALSTSELADQIEQIKITPQTMSTEEMSKLWAALTAHYRPSANYQVSVVLIESKYRSRAALPVLTRGQPNPVTHRDEGVIVQPNLLSPFPTLQKVEPPNEQLFFRMGEVLTFTGYHLDGTSVTAQFTHLRSTNALELSANAGATETQFQIQIPLDPPLAPVPNNSPLNPDNWQVGVYSVVGAITKGGKTRATNQMPVVLAPKITALSASKVAGVVTLTVKCSPKVWQTQQVTLTVSDREIPAEPITVVKTDTLAFKSSDVPSGPQWVRLRVDGIDSILIDRTTKPPTFDPSQQVTIP